MCIRDRSRVVGEIKLGVRRERESSLISNFSSVQSYFNFRQSILNLSSVDFQFSNGQFEFSSYCNFGQFQSILNLTPISSSVYF